MEFSSFASTESQNNFCIVESNLKIPLRSHAFILLLSVNRIKVKAAPARRNI